MKQLLTQTLQTALNTLLQLDPETSQRLSGLQGNVVSVELLPFNVTIQLLISDNALHIQEEAILQPDVTIRGTLLQLTALSLNQDEKQRFFANDINIEGNALLAQDVLHLFSHLHIDWEELLSNVIGDSAAYHAGKFARRTSQWLRNVEQSLAKDVTEYVQEEAQWLPSREALQDLFNEIDNLQMDVDRIEAKILQLKKWS